MEAIKKRIIKFLGIEALTENPNNERYTYINDASNIVKQKLAEYKVWYYGDSDELLNYYTSAMAIGNNREPVYNRNRRGYFWGIATTESNIKRVHSGIPNAIITTLVNAIGNPNVSIADQNLDKQLNDIILANDMVNVVNQQQMPLTLVEGWGAYKINFDKNLSKHPIIQFYEAENVDFVYKSGILIAIIYRDYYTYEDKDYVLIETRRISDGDSYIEYELFRLEKNNNVVSVSLNEIPDLECLYGNETLVIKGFNKILGVPSKFFFDPLNKNYGKSAFAGKIDLFDDLDQILSQDSQTVRVSTPVEYYPIDLLERDKQGNPKMPKVYNRQYVKKDSIPDGEGNLNSNIETTQPQLNFDQYNANAISKLNFILTGILSPATMGIDVAKKDNAEAQREKEKVTIMTRNNIIDRETKILKELYGLCLSIQEFLDTGKITIQDYDISVNFNEFANPSFENELQVLGPAWSDGQLSTERYVELLWGNNLSDAEKQEEISKLEENRQADNITMEDFEDETPIRTIDNSEREETEQLLEDKE